MAPNTTTVGGESRCSSFLHWTLENAWFNNLSLPFLREVGILENPKQNFWNLAVAGSRAVFTLFFCLLMLYGVCGMTHYVGQAAWNTEVSCLCLGHWGYSAPMVLTTAF